MVSDSERNQLLNEYRREPASVARLLLTCAVGLLIVFALGWVSFDIHTFSADTAGQTPTAQLRQPSP
jgi:hypothetical protein